MAIFDTVNAWSSWATVMLDLGLKSLVIMAATLLVLYALRQSSAAVRHIVCAIGLLSLLVLPILTMILPPLSLPVGWRDVPNEGGSFVERTAQFERESFREDIRPVRPSLEGGPVTRMRANSTETPTSWLMTLWGLGMVTMLVALSVNIVRRKQMSRTAKWVPLEPWATQAHELSRQLNLNRPVMLLESPDVAVPMTWGWIKPVILLPLHAQDWPQARRELVLLHELTHIKRRDQLIQFLGQLTCALYWFNPLVWVVLLKMQQEQENACDNEVLIAGTKPSDYAEHLLEVVRSLRTTNRLTLATVPMARSSKLAVRVRSILSENVRRMPINRRVFALALVLIAFAILPLAAARSGPAPSPSKSVNLRSLFQPAIDGIEIALGVFSLPDDAEQEPKAERDTEQEPKTDYDIGYAREWAIAAQPHDGLTVDIKPNCSIEILGGEENHIWVKVETRESKVPRVSLGKTSDGFVLKSFYKNTDDPKPRTKVHYKIHVPYQFHLFLQSVNGNVTIRRINGTILGEDIVGDLHMNDIRGHLNITNNGAITLRDSRVEGKARTLSTDQVLLRNVQGDIRAYNIKGVCINENVIYMNSNGNQVKTTGNTRYADIAKKYEREIAREYNETVRGLYLDRFQEALQKANEQRDIQSQALKKVLEKHRAKLEKLRKELDQMDLGELRKQIQNTQWEDHKDLRKLKQELERDLGIKLPDLENFQVRTKEDFWRRNLNR